MIARALVWRAALWLGVIAFFAANLWGALTSDYTGLVGFAAFPVVGAIILSSRSRNGVGWLLYLIGMVWIFNTLVINNAALIAAPTWLQTVSTFGGWYGWGCIPLIGLLFPTGRIETRAGRVLAWALVGYSTLAALATTIDARTPSIVTGEGNPLAWPPAQPLVEIVLGLPGIAVFVGTIVGIIVDLALRWRRSTGVQRLQYRWLVWGLALVVLFVSVSGMLNVFFGSEPWVAVASALFTVTINLIPISIGIAVTRHGLYEIGRVVSRTVSYAIVTVLVVGVYALAVTSLSTLMPRLPSLGVAIATLASAALFLPVLRWVQRGIDRRFDRERYDAEKVVEEFGEHLRTSVAPSVAGSEFLDAVESTLQPASVGLWTSGAIR